MRAAAPFTHRHEKEAPQKRRFFFVYGATFSGSWGVPRAVAAIHGLVAARLERNFRYAAALAARGFEHFALAAAAATVTAAAAFTA